MGKGNKSGKNRKEKKKAKRLKRDKDRKVKLALDSCWLEVKFGAYPNAFRSKPRTWLRGPDTFAKVFPDMIDHYDERREWLLECSRELGELCKQEAGEGNPIKLSHAKAAVRTIKARHCTSPPKNVLMLGGWCNFEVT